LPGQDARPAIVPSRRAEHRGEEGQAALTARRASRCIAGRPPVRYVVARPRRRTEMAERYIVVGGGLAGLMTVIKLAEAGKDGDVFSIVPVKRSHSVCAQGGINGAVNTK